MANVNSDELSLPDRVILRILDHVGRPTASTKLVKLVYLVDYIHFQHFGNTLTGLKYHWDHFGPNALGHGIVSSADSLVDDTLVEKKTMPNIYGGQTVQYRVSPSVETPQLDEVGEMVIHDVIAQYGWHSVTAITKASKKTAPFDSAVQFEPLGMEMRIPAIQIEEDDWEAHIAELEEEGTVSLEELVEEYGLL